MRVRLQVRCIIDEHVHDDEMLRIFTGETLLIVDNDIDDRNLVPALSYVIYLLSSQQARRQRENSTTFTHPMCLNLERTRKILTLWANLGFTVTTATRPQHHSEVLARRWGTYLEPLSTLVTFWNLTKNQLLLEW